MTNRTRRLLGCIAALGIATAVPAVLASAAVADGDQPTYSEGCHHAAFSTSATVFGGAGNAVPWSVEKVLDAKRFSAGEQVEFIASNGWELGYGDTASLHANGELVASSGVGGQVVVPYVIPTDGTYQFTGRFETGLPRLGTVAGTLSFSCRPPLDSDHDTVLDVIDECPGTVLPDVATEQQGRNRYLANASGEFEVDGQASGWTLSDTRGCSATQIIDATGLGDGHRRFGISHGELSSWITMP